MKVVEPSKLHPALHHNSMQPSKGSIRSVGTHISPSQGLPQNSKVSDEMTLKSNILSDQKTYTEASNEPNEVIAGKSTAKEESKRSSLQDGGHNISKIANAGITS